MSSFVVHLKPYIQPFERELAMRELYAVSGHRPKPADDSGVESWAFSVPSMPENGLTRLAYWEAGGPDRQPTSQVRREASVGLARNGFALEALPAATDEQLLSKLPRKRVLRYGTHGIHEYRGKFFPQLVKALINISGVNDGAVVLDPMCGSGTTIAEAVTAGMSGVGVDMNPLSVFISRAKTSALTLSAEDVLKGFATLTSALECHDEKQRPIRSAKDEEYLADWFSPSVLSELGTISNAVDQIGDSRLRDFYSVALSNILRAVSFQKEGDLRVRREDKTIIAGTARALFQDEALRSTKALVSFLSHGALGHMGTSRVEEGDARAFIPRVIAPEEVDLVITSPPYATALPYLDTDRLSLVYLGLLERSSHRGRDRLMIGNREVTGRGRQEMWQAYLAARHELPPSASELIDLIEDDNSRADVGFRRKNLGALLGQYFTDMRMVLGQTLEALKPGASAYFVVGNNRTTISTGQLEIPTANILLDMARLVGFVSCEKIEMEMLISRDIFRDNQTPSEHILHFRKSEVSKAAG